jgi:serine/threonine protein kinase
MTLEQVLEVVTCTASSLAHLHSLGACVSLLRSHLNTFACALTPARAGISHGDVYGHNIMARPDGAALLGDFGAATIYTAAGAGEGADAAALQLQLQLQLQRIEVRALGVLMLELLSIVKDDGSSSGGGSSSSAAQRMALIAQPCVSELFEERPLFAAVLQQLQQLQQLRAGGV